jgi:hypothetical protein
MFFGIQGMMDGWAKATIAADFMSKVGGTCPSRLYGEVIHKLFETSEKKYKPVKICIIL